jgi:hypothetical protein
MDILENLMQNPYHLIHLNIILAAPRLGRVDSKANLVGVKGVKTPILDFLHLSF